MQKTMMSNNPNPNSLMKMKQADVILLGDEKGMTWLLEKLDAKKFTIFESLSKKVEHIVEDSDRKYTASIKLQVHNRSELRQYHFPVITDRTEAAVIVYNVTDTIGTAVWMRLCLVENPGREGSGDWYCESMTSNAFRSGGHTLDLYKSTMKWIKELRQKGRSDIIVSLLGYNDSECNDPWVRSINAMSRFGEKTGVLLHTVVNIGCCADVIHQMLTEISRAIYAAREYSRDAEMSLPVVQGVFSSSFLMMNRSLKITPVLEGS